MIISIEGWVQYAGEGQMTSWYMFAPVDPNMARAAPPALSQRARRAAGPEGWPGRDLQAGKAPGRSLGPPGSRIAIRAPARVRGHHGRGVADAV